MATVGINNSINAALLAMRILGITDSYAQKLVDEYSASARRDNMESKNPKLYELGWKNYLKEMDGT